MLASTLVSLALAVAPVPQDSTPPAAAAAPAAQEVPSVEEISQLVANLFEGLQKK